MHALDIRYLSKIPTVNIVDVGELIAESVHHRVYLYSTDKVIKVPRFRYSYLYSTHSHLENDLAFLKEHFPELLPATEVHHSPNFRRHCVVQQRLVHTKHITAPLTQAIRAQLETLATRNTGLYKKYRVSLDPMGGVGIKSCIESIFKPNIRPHFSNMVVELTDAGAERLLLLDTELLRLRLKSIHWVEVMWWVSSQASLIATRLFLRLFFKVRW